MIAAVDGCKKGWVVAVADKWPLYALPSIHLCPDFKSVVSTVNQCRVTVIDIPIGLLSKPGLRQCDQLAREQLKEHRGAGSRVFEPPPRQTLPAENRDQFHHLHRESFGIPGNPSYGILMKVREVDEEIDTTLQEQVKEFHPEVAWKNLAGRVLPSKHTALGILCRIELIQQSCPDFDALKDTSVCSKVAIDDLLDAFVGLAAAYCIDQGPDYNRRLPAAEPPKDNRGLRMEIWF
jgi:predicted RNase H-like nuclease